MTPSFLPAIAVFFPIFCGVLLLFLKIGKGLRFYVEGATVITSVLVFVSAVFPASESLALINFTNGITFSLAVDSIGRIFALLAAFLWPLATLYGFEYMEKERFNKLFFAFYTMTYGITIGIAFAEDLFTMYVFYEFLTLATIPLVMHGFGKKSFAAARKYMYYSLGGSAFALIGLIYLIHYAGSTDFTAGGLFDGNAPESVLLIYFITFMGFGVKAAVFPLHDWLPSAAVAPTPVTALLHAVAVVKAGAFAIIRITYFCFGAELLSGTWAQYAVTAVSCVTILFGSVMSLKENHFKRRLAYSTVSNLSYIVFAASLMSEAGLTAALLHLLAHGLTKICSFFCAGSILQKTGREYVSELDGTDRIMPLTCACFTVSAVSLTGIPPFAGFISKWAIGTAAAEASTVPAMIGLGVILVSALLTAIYMFSPVVRMYFGKNTELQTVNEAGTLMKATVAVLAVVVVLFGVFSGQITEYISAAASTAFVKGAM